MHKLVGHRQHHVGSASHFRRYHIDSSVFLRDMPAAAICSTDAAVSGKIRFWSPFRMCSA